MRKVLKWIGIVLGSLLGLLVLIIVGFLIYGQISFKPVQANRPLYQIQADVSPEGLARGKYLVENVMGCAGACHSPSPETPFIGVMDKLNMGPAELEFNIAQPDPRSANRPGFVDGCGNRARDPGRRGSRRARTGGHARQQLSRAERCRYGGHPGLPAQSAAYQQ